MSNGQTHKLASGLIIGAFIAKLEIEEKGEVSWATPAGGVLAYLCGTLPDILEPATNGPNHRQFFHSILFGVFLGYQLCKLWHWEPEETWQQFLKGAGSIACGAYILHLIMDASTPKSLPII